MKKYIFCSYLLVFRKNETFLNNTFNKKTGLYWELSPCQVSSKSNDSCESYDFFSKIKLNCYFSILFLELRDLTRTKSKYYQIWHFLILLGAVDHQINVLRNCTALNDYFRYISKMAATKQWKWGLFQSKPEVWNNTIWLKDKKTWDIYIPLSCTILLKTSGIWMSYGPLQFFKNLHKSYFA